MTAALLTLLLTVLVPPLPVEDPEPLVYPTFEPFVASRMFKILGDPSTADLDKLSRMVQGIARANRVAKEAAPVPSSAGPSALLMPEIAQEQRSIACLIPVVMMKLEPLWTTPAWNPAQVADAHAGAAILALMPDAPRPAFAAGRDADNRAGLEQLVRWYHAKVSRPEWYASMLFTMDDGPYAGLSYESAELLPSTAVLALDEKTELRLCRVERKNEPWVLQAAREGKPLWSRVLSAAPDESVSEVSPIEDPVQRLGPYGWKVQFVATWSGGSELAEVFLDPKANLLFYFLSW